MVRYLHGIDVSKGQPCRLSDACFPQIFYHSCRESNGARGVCITSVSVTCCTSVGRDTAVTNAPNRQLIRFLLGTQRR